MIGLGSARPVVSITIASKVFLRSGFVTSSTSTRTRSSRTVQHRQPLESVTTVSPDSPKTSREATSAESMSTSPNSFSMTARRGSGAWPGSVGSRGRVRRWLSRVVFPEPRKPVMTCWGRGCGWGLRERKKEREGEEV